ncbi:MAG: glycine cleavage system protein GcvH [Candidatus Bathyarchaeota archaeon]|jgi:glycine cleavage system H protein|nr:glycine cleavage system protein GcvH [Candidatus Termiticorpusculum sp.]MCL1970176.1 glycine cleavage system protein GcvH [Candidatus Termiticorpusculum sp.]
MVEVEGYSVPEGLCYSKDFAWVKIENDRVRVGITDYAQKTLREIVYTELPDVGLEVKQNEPYGTLESVKAVYDIVLPVSGRVEEVNEEVLSHPELLNEDPYGKAWLLIIRPSDLQTELGNLMDFDRAVEWHKMQVREK